MGFDHPEEMRPVLAVQLAKGRAWTRDKREWDEMTTPEQVEAIAEAEAWVDAAGEAGLAIVGLGVDRGHFRDRTEHTATVIQESARVLAYAAEHGRGLTYPADLYRLMSDLSGTGHYLNEAVGRSAAWLADQAASGRVALDRSGEDGDVLEFVAKANAALADVATAADAFGRSASRAQGALSRLESTGA